MTITLTPVDGGTEVRLVHDGLTAQQAARHAKGGTTSWTGWSSPANAVTPVPTNGPQRPIRSTNYLVPKQHWPFFSTYCAG